MNTAEKLKEPEVEVKKPALRIVQPAPKEIQELIDNGIPLKMAVFHRTVLSFGNFGTVTGEPENAFWAPSGDKTKPNAKPSRTAKMWYTPHGLVCEQHGIYKIIPTANVSDTIVL